MNMFVNDYFLSVDNTNNIIYGHKFCQTLSSCIYFCQYYFFDVYVKQSFFLFFLIHIDLFVLCYPSIL